VKLQALLDRHYREILGREPDADVLERLMKTAAHGTKEGSLSSLKYLLRALDHVQLAGDLERERMQRARRPVVRAAPHPRAL
jgi:hypothetical protein